MGTTRPRIPTPLEQIEALRALARRHFARAEHYGPLSVDGKAELRRARRLLDAADELTRRYERLLDWVQGDAGDDARR